MVDEGEVPEGASARELGLEGEGAGAPAGPARWGAAEYGISAAALLGLWAVSWLYGGAGLWKTAMVIYCLVLIGALWEKGWKVAAVVAIAAAGGLLLGLLCAPSFVYIDNFSPRAVRIEKDGSPWVKLASQEKTRVRLRGGRHKLTVLSTDGEKLRELPVDIPRDGGAFVFNVLGWGTYRKGRVVYRAGPSFGGGGKQVVDAEWIDANVDYLFKEPPSSISSSSSGAEVKTYLVRKGRKLVPPGKTGKKK